MRFARWIRRSITLTLLLSTLVAACSSSPAEPTLPPTSATGLTNTSPIPSTPMPRDFDGVTITFACHDFQRAHYSSLADTFHDQHPTIRVRLVSIEEATGNPANVKSSDDLGKIARAADAFVEHPGELDRPSRESVFLNLTDLAAEDETFSSDDFYTGILALFRKEGKLWGLPSYANVRVLFYNPSLFDKANVPHPRIGWSWDDFLEAASTLTIREEGEVVHYGYIDPWPGYSIFSLAYQKIGPLVDREQEPPEIRLDRPGVAETLKWYADLTQVHGVMPNLLEMDHVAQDQLIWEGSPAMWVDYSYQRDAFKHRYDASVAPLPETGEPATLITAQGYFVSAGTAHPQEAWRWIKFLSGQPSSHYGRGIPPRKSVAEETGYWDALGEETAAVYAHCLEHAVTDAEHLWVDLHWAFKSVLDGESVETALSQRLARAKSRMAESAERVQSKPTPFAVATAVPAASGAGIQISFRVPPGTDLNVWRDLAERFHEEHPDISVEIAWMTSASLAEQSDDADCFVGYTSRLLTEGSDSVLPLDAFVEGTQFDLEPYCPALLESAQAEGKLWALPLGADASFLYYNPALFDAAGVPYPSGDWTPEQFIERAIALTDESAGVVGLYHPQEGPESVYEHLAWLGGQAFDAGDRPTFDDPSMIAALTEYASLVAGATDQETAPSLDVYFNATRSMSTSGYPEPIRLGKVAMWMESTAMAARRAMTNETLPYEVGVSVIPAGDYPLSDIRAQSLFISAKAEHPDICWAWLSFLSAQPEAVSRLPARRDMAKDATWRLRVGQATADAWMALLEREEPAHGRSYPSYAYRTMYWLYVALDDVLGGTPPSSALAEVQKKASAFTACIAGTGEVTDEITFACAREADPQVRIYKGER